MWHSLRVFHTAYVRHSVGLSSRAFHTAPVLRHDVGQVQAEFFRGMLTPKNLADIQFTEIDSMETTESLTLRVWGASKYIQAKGKGTPAQIERGGVVIGSVATLTPLGVSALFELAQAALPGWQQLEEGKRNQQLAKFWEVCHASEHELSELARTEVAAENEDPAVANEAARGVLASIENAVAGLFPTAVGGGQLQVQDHPIPIGCEAVRVRTETDVWHVGRVLALGQGCVFICEGRSSLLPLAIRQCAIQAGLPEALITVVTGKQLRVSG